MKILHIITSLENGGAEGALYRLVIGDRRNAHEVVSLMDEGTYGPRLADAGVPVHALDMPRGRVKLRGLLKLYRLIRAIRPDVVQTWMYHADLVGGVTARVAGAKRIVWSIRGPFDRARTSLSTRLTIKSCALLSRWIPCAIICNSEYASRVHVAVGYDSEKLVDIPNGYLLDRFRPDANARQSLRDEFGLARDSLLIGMVARFDPYKDHENLFAALAACRESCRLNCLLVGPGMTRENPDVVRLVERFGLADSVRLLGPRDDVARIMAGLDFHVLSSAAESFPNVLAEAMACGTPCVTTAVGDAPVIVADTGWLVRPSDSQALKDAIVQASHAMSDDEHWQSRRESCRARVLNNYSLERMIASYSDVWWNFGKASA
jgi:glycosyltransferase involved in cell wall biosynthesis